jgi:16S rRNA (guanine966-N2)-methyltransferase
VLDLFAGSGALGLEALSRGAASVDFVENGRAALHALKANVARLRARPHTRVFARDALAFVNALEPGAYDVAFADAPYTSALAEHVVRRWLEVRFSRVLGVEHAVGTRLPGRGHTTEQGEGAFTLYR